MTTTAKDFMDNTINVGDKIIYTSPTKGVMLMEVVKINKVNMKCKAIKSNHTWAIERDGDKLMDVRPKDAVKVA